MNVLIAGVTGFLGSALSSECKKHADKVWGLLSRPQLPPTDVEKIFTLHELAHANIDFDVIYIAAGNYTLSRHQLAQVNEILPQLLCDLYPKAKIIFVSSTEVYAPTHKVITETSPTGTHNPYGISKLLGEQIVLQHQHSAVVRLSYLYDRRIPNRSFLPTIITHAQEKKVIPLTNNGERVQDYIHVADAARLLYLATQHTKKNIFLGASGESISNTDIAEKICTLVPSCKINYTGESSAPSYIYNPQWTMNMLAWSPQHHLLDYLQEMVV